MRVEKNEAGLCEAVIRLLEADVGACRHDVRFPEVDGIGPPVECRFGLGKRRYAIEHTLIEPFANHIRTGAEFEELVRPVEAARSEEHTSELQSLMRISYAVFCLKKK